MGRNIIVEIKKIIVLTKIDKKDLTKSQQDIIKEAKAQMVYLARQLDQFPETPEEVNEDIERVVVEFYRNEQEENKVIERVVEKFIVKRIRMR